MDCCKKGNVLIVVLLVTALASLVGIMSLKTVLWAQDFNHATFTYERSIRLAQGLLRCGLERGARDFDALCKKAVTVNSTICVEGYTYTLALEPAKEMIRASCSLCQNDKTLAIVRAELFRNEHKNLQVRGFQR